MIQMAFVNPNTLEKSTFLYQWDTNVHGEFELTGNIISDVECVFSVVGMQEGIRKDCVLSGKTCVVRVPDIVLTYGSDVHVFVTYTAGGRRTVEEALIKIKRATRPQGYVTTDSDDFISFETLLGEVKGAKVELRKNDKIVQWKYLNDTEWHDLYSIDELKGDPFTYDDFTPEQLKNLKGEKGEPFRYSDFTPDQLEALKGKDGYTPQKGIDYFDGEDGYTPRKGIDYFDGEDGKSAYQIAKENGFFGSEKEWLESLKGEPGDGANITEETVSGWGFTKNTGDYSKPESGIPESDLSEEVKKKLNEETVKTDTTLTKEGFAADAKAAGEAIKSLKDKTVEKVEGKGLSSNDFTDDLKEKLEDTVEVDFYQNEDGDIEIVGHAIGDKIIGVVDSILCSTDKPLTEEQKINAQRRLGILPSEGVLFGE